MALIDKRISTKTILRQVHRANPFAGKGTLCIITLLCMAVLINFWIKLVTPKDFFCNVESLKNKRQKKLSDSELQASTKN